MYNWLKKYVDPIVPLFAIIPLVSCFIFNTCVYSGTMVLCANLQHYNLGCFLDDMIPLVPEWMSVYFGCYAFWISNYIIAARINRDDRPNFYRFVATDICCKFVCACFFIWLPTQNVRPEVIGDGVYDNMLRFLYSIDQPTNLFPSIHCLVSWICFVGVRKSDKVSPYYKLFSLLCAVFVCISTQFTKQHWIIDAIGAIVLVEAVYYFNSRVSFYKCFQSIFIKVNQIAIIILGKKQKRGN